MIRQLSHDTIFVPKDGWEFRPGLHAYLSVELASDATRVLATSPHLGKIESMKLHELLLALGFTITEKDKNGYTMQFPDNHFIQWRFEETRILYTQIDGENVPVEFMKIDSRPVGNGVQKRFVITYYGAILLRDAIRIGEMSS